MTLQAESGRETRGTYYEHRIALALSRRFGSSSSGGAGVIVYRQGGVTAGNVYATWAGIQAAKQPGTTIMVDSSLAPGGLSHVPGTTGVTDLTTNPLVPFHQSTGPAAGFTLDALQVDDGATLHNLRYIGNALSVQLDSKTVDGLSFDHGAPSEFDELVIDGGALYMTSTATRPGCTLPPAGEVDVTLRLLGSFGVFGVSQPLFALMSTGTLAFLVYDGADVDNDSVSGMPGSSIPFLHDSGTGLPTFSAFTGTLSDQRIDLAQWAMPAASTVANLPTSTALDGQMNFTDDASPDGTPLWWSAADDLWVGPELFGTATGTAPTATPGGNAGAGATAAIIAGGDDTGGVVTVTAGAGPTAGALVSVNFTGGGLPNDPRTVVITAANTAAASLQPYVNPALASGFGIGCNVEPVDGGVYRFFYLVRP